MQGEGTEREGEEDEEGGLTEMEIWADMKAKGSGF